MTPYLIAADIGGSHISSIVLNTNDWIVEPTKMIETKANSFGQKHTLIQSWADNLLESAQKANIKNINQIALAIPGPFDYEKGIFHTHPEGKMGSLVGEHLRELLIPFFGKALKITFENDAACFGLGEASFGVGQKCQRIIGVTLGTGIGSSFIAQQKIIKTHSSIPLGGELYESPFENSIADDYFSTRWFVRQVLKDIGLKISGVRELTEKAPEDYIQVIFKKFALNFYQFLLPFAKDFGAEMIVVGGNIAKAWRYFGKELAELFQKEAILVQPSYLNEQAIILGAAKVFVDTFKSVK